MRTVTQDIAGLVCKQLCENFGDDPTVWPNHPDTKSYLTASKETGLRVFNCGIEQTIAYLYARNEDKHIRLLAADINFVLSHINNYENDVRALQVMQNRGFCTKVLFSEQVIDIVEWIGYYMVGAEVNDA